ncbi:hypothetical protein niasHS_006459 [Heterodera schachtii]|uniref:polynucleotide adenylyltransferase n=1 Tax=Heterodera schachtii TaxID=97005 RepID=A0ABD2JHL5_HETSC
MLLDNAFKASAVNSGGEMPKRMSYSSVVMARSSSSSSASSSISSSSSIAPPPPPLPKSSSASSSFSSYSSCSSSSSLAANREFVPKNKGEQKKMPKRHQQRWKRWRTVTSESVFLYRSSSSSLLSLDSATSTTSSSNSSGIGTSDAETPPLAFEGEQRQQQKPNSSSRSATSKSQNLCGGTALKMAADGKKQQKVGHKTAPTAAAHCCPVEEEEQQQSMDKEQQQFEASSTAHSSSGGQSGAASSVLLVDLSNPMLQQFYVQQRLFFRQIYAQQFAALSARLGMVPSSVEETVFDPSVPHQHLGFPPASPPIAQLAHLDAFFGSSSAEECFGSSASLPSPTDHNGSPPSDESVVYSSSNCFSTADAMAPPPATVDEYTLSQSRFPSVASLAPPTVLMMSTAGQTPVHRSRHCSAGSNSAQPNNSHEAISRMDVLSERIRDFHYNEDQTHAQLNRKLQLRDQLYYAISPIFPMCGLYIVGSSLNGFGTKRSDLDLCLMITNRDIDQRTDAVVVLSSVMRTLESNQIVAEQNLILAKVPILRIKFIGTFHDITVDLNVNNSVAIRNTHLMCYYSSFDWRVRPLVMVVKEWAKRHGINDSACSSFTSYSLVLMVIHYLQCGAQPPVLPNLQQMYPKRFSVRADVRTLNVSLPFEPIPTAMGWQFKDDATLSELLLGFLRYYAFQFDFDADAISIRMGKKVNRAQVAQNQSPFNTLSQWHCICIEEPFTLSNAAHSVYDERIFQDIKKAFVDSYRELDKHRDLDRFLGPTVEASTAPLGQ